MNGNSNVDILCGAQSCATGRLSRLAAVLRPTAPAISAMTAGIFRPLRRQSQGSGNSSDSGGVEEGPAWELAKAVVEAIGHLHSRTRNKHLIERKQSFLDSF
jgi:hypothetical protein